MALTCYETGTNFGIHKLEGIFQYWIRDGVIYCYFTMRCVKGRGMQKEGDVLWMEVLEMGLP